MKVVDIFTWPYAKGLRPKEIPADRNSVPEQIEWKKSPTKRIATQKNSDLKKMGRNQKKCQADKNN